MASHLTSRTARISWILIHQACRSIAQRKCPDIQAPRFPSFAKSIKRPSNWDSAEMSDFTISINFRPHSSRFFFFRTDSVFIQDINSWCIENEPKWAQFLPNCFIVFFFSLCSFFLLLAIINLMQRKNFKNREMADRKLFVPCVFSSICKSNRVIYWKIEFSSFEDEW